MAAKAGRLELLQAELDAAVEHLRRAAQEKASDGCFGLLGGLGSCFSVWVGVYLVARWSSSLWTGIGVLVAAGICLRLIHKLIVRPAPGLALAKASLKRLGEQLTGEEELRLDPEGRQRLHSYLDKANNAEAIGVLKVLGCAGNGESLRYAEAASGASMDSDRRAFADPRVRKAAESAARQIRERIETAKQSSTLLRPAAPAEPELLRPVQSTMADDQAMLLRAETEEDSGR